MLQSGLGHFLPNSRFFFFSSPWVMFKFPWCTMIIRQGFWPQVALRRAGSSLCAGRVLVKRGPRSADTFFASCLLFGATQLATPTRAFGPQPNWQWPGENQDDLASEANVPTRKHKQGGGGEARRGEARRERGERSSYFEGGCTTLAGLESMSGAAWPLPPMFVDVLESGGMARCARCRLHH